MGVPGSCTEVSQLLSKCIPLQPQRDSDLRWVFPPASRSELHEGSSQVEHRLEEGGESVWTGFPHKEQPGTGAVPAKQGVEGPQHDAWS